MKNILKDTLTFLRDSPIFFSVFLQRSKSAEKFVSFDQVNFKRINFNSDHQKEKRIGELIGILFISIKVVPLFPRQHGHPD